MSGEYLVSFSLLLTLLLAAAFFFSNRHSLKFFTLALAIFLASGTYFGVENYKGWPSYRKYPTGWIVAIEIREPSEDTSDKGEIFIWLYPKVIKHSTFGFAPSAASPRGYSLPYNKNAAEEMGRAKDKLKQGFQVLIQGEDEGGTEGDSNKKNESKEKKDGLGDVEDYHAPSLKIIPPTEFLQKDN
jgi:hypothetical protein